MKSFFDGGVIIKGKEFSTFPTNVQVWSYLMVFVPILCIPGYAIYKLIVTPGKDFDEVIFSRSDRSMKRQFALAFATIDQTGRAAARADSFAVHRWWWWRYERRYVRRSSRNS